MDVDVVEVDDVVDVDVDEVVELHVDVKDVVVLQPVVVVVGAVGILRDPLGRTVDAVSVAIAPVATST